MSVVPEVLSILGIAAVSSTLVAFVGAILSARKSAAAKRRISSIVRSNVRVQNELLKAMHDHQIDDKEARTILRVIGKAIDEDDKRFHASKNSDARLFVRNLHPYKSRRVIEDLAREVEERRVSA